jgi:hypothetical protein
MYAATDFILALVKDDDWLGEAAATVHRDHQDNCGHLSSRSLNSS